MTIHIRPYQAEAIHAIRHEWQQGKKSTLLVMATGAGKTVVLLQLSTEELEATNKRALIIAHRQELIDQPIERLCQFWPAWKWRAGVVQADRDECSKQIIVATVQTLSNPKRLARILQHGAIDYLITDEAHHATASTYKKVYDQLRAANPDMCHLGVTATPVRSDRAGLREVFESVAATYDIRKLVSLGWLVPPRWLAIATGISLKNVSSNGGDFVQRDLANVYETDNCLDLVVETHKKYACGRKSIAFTVGVSGAHELARKFRAAGISAASADGTTKREERAKILRDFQAGVYEVLVNCSLYTEGLDVPEVACIHQVRPTKSDSLYLQMVGRGLRPVPGKDDCLILDYAPAESRKVVFLGDVLGIPKELQLKQQEEDEEVLEEEIGEVLGGFTFDGVVTGLTGSPLELVARQLDYLNLSPFSWDRRDGWLVLGLGPDDQDKDRTLAISPINGNNFCKLFIIEKTKGTWTTTINILDEGAFSDLSQVANLYAEQHGNTMLSGKGKSWQKNPPSPQQVGFLMKLAKGELEQTEIETMTRGDVAKRVTFYLARQALRQKGYWR